jgi:hypothetical protein
VEIKLLIFGGAFFILLAERVGMPKEWWRMVWTDSAGHGSFE